MCLCPYFGNECLVVLNRNECSYFYMPSLESDLFKHLALLNSVVEETRAVVKNQE